ncbi:MAG: recombination protein RecR [Oscillospiraceae bacterium]|nr:recombination protein RecR [Oscillospiraceae bacterium]
MSGYSPTLEALIEKFRSLPGIGGKTAVRLAFHMLNANEEYVSDFAECILAAKSRITVCKVCQNISDEEICPVCSDMSRDHGLICVVESAKDILTFERVKEYNGVYHVLHGLISPMDGINAEDIRVKELISRITGVNFNRNVGDGVLDVPQDGEPDEMAEIYNEIAKTKVNEIILATNSNVEGEVTATYISKLVKPFGVITSRLAYGIPVGGELEYADAMTLFKALEGRREI